ncbi:MAG: PKD domain-containing protein [Acidobacteriota bacterium]|jgi:hypothetical protein
MAESLFLNKTKIDIYDKPITRRIQIGEVTSMTERKSSFSYTIKIPKTSRNKAFFEMLGTMGNTSRKPYEEVLADYVVDGVYLVSNGYAIIRESSGEDYQINLIDGIRSLSELLKDKKLSDLPLEDLNHILTTQNYIDSYSNKEGFIYAIADFGRGVSSAIKVEKQAPSIFTHTLFRRIFEANGLTLQGEFFTTNEKYLNEVLTPSRGYTLEYSSVISEDKGGTTSNTVSEYETSNEYLTQTEKITLVNNSLVGASISDGEILFSVAGTYRLDIAVDYNLYETYASIIVKKNGSAISYISLLTDEYSKTKKIVFSVSAGDKISVYITASSYYDYYYQQEGGYQYYTLNYSASIISTLYLQTGGQVISPIDYIGEMNQLDFLKDVINRYGLVLHPVQNTNEFKFKRIEALLSDRATAEDWSSKLVSIDSEDYVSGYAKTNKASFKYDESIVVPTNDGELLIDNVNAESEKTMFTSPFEIPAKGTSLSGNSVYKVPIWGEETQTETEVETQLTEDGIGKPAILKTDGTIEIVNLVPSDSRFDSSTVIDGTDIGVFSFNLGEANVNSIVIQEGGIKIDITGTGGNVMFSDTSIISGITVGNDVHTKFKIKWLTGSATMYYAVTTSTSGALSITPSTEWQEIDVKLPKGSAYPNRVAFFWAGVSGQQTVIIKDLIIDDTEIEDRIEYKFLNIDLENKTFKASGRVRTSDNAFVCFYDSDDNFISYQGKGSGSNFDYTKTTLYPPSNTRTIRISGSIDVEPELYYYEDIQYTTAVNEETALKVMYIERHNLSINAKLFDESTGVSASEDIPFLGIEFMTMQYFLNVFYSAFQNLIENYKKMTFTINLSVIDIFNIDFFKLKFLKQTGRFYYLNAIQNTQGKPSKVEMIEIKEFPSNKPPTQIGNFSFNMQRLATRTITLNNLKTGYEDPELDEPLKIKIIDGFNSNVLLKQDGVTITEETEILASELALTAVEVLGGVDDYVEQWSFTIADKGSGTYPELTGILTANVLEYTNYAPNANAGEDNTVYLTPPEVYSAPSYIQLNGSASNDSTGEIVSYAWEILSKPTNSDATLSSESGTIVSLIVTNDEENVGVYECQLTVTDEFGLTDTDTVKITCLINYE